MPMWMNPTLIFHLQWGFFFDNLQKYQHKEPLQDLVVPGMTVKEFWQYDNKGYMEFEYGKPLIPK
jgi:hypothetical protein